MKIHVIDKDLTRGYRMYPDWFPRQKKNGVADEG